MKESSSHQSFDLYIVGGTLLTMNERREIISDGVIHVRDGKIFNLGSRDQIEIPKQAQCLDASDCLVMPGILNGHTHCGMGLLRGMAEDVPLEDWLYKIIFPLERKWGSSEFVYLGSLLSMMEMVKSGTTTFNDMYYFEEATAKAAHEIGLRGICGQTVIEISRVDNPLEMIASHFDKFYSEISKYPRLSVAIAPHSLYGVSSELLKEVIFYAREKKIPLHIHLSETEQEVSEVQKKFSMRPVPYAEKVGLFDAQVIAAHCAVLTEEDIEILGKHHVGVIHNAESNLKLGSKICPVVSLRKAGAHVGLGSDGVASNNNLDLLTEVDFVSKLQSYQFGAGALKAEEAVGLLTIEGARALGLEKKIGSLEVGKYADVIALDLNRPHAVPFHNAYAHVVFAASGGDVKHSVVQGRILMKDFCLTQLDEALVLKEAKQWGQRIRNEFSSLG